MALFREREFWALAALAALTYLPRLDVLPTRGEETRRAQIAREMAWTGDWIVPRQQGEPFLSRPPLHNWLIAASAAFRGQMDLTAIRLPTAISMLAATGATYAFARTFLAPCWALLAGCAFAFGPQTLQGGRTAECDTLFAALLAAGLFAWGAAWLAPDPRGRWRGWALGYAGAALATLVKGPQGIAFFVAPVGLCLWQRGELRELLSRGHAAGVAAFLALAAPWHAAFAARLGAARLRELWGGDVQLRFVEQTAASFAVHLAAFPAELFVMLLPWPLLLLWRRSGPAAPAGPAPPAAVFLLCCVAATFPAVWFPPGARLRYYLPLFPALAVLIAWAAARRFAGARESAVAVRTLAFSALAAALHTGPYLDLLTRRSIDTRGAVAALGQLRPPAEPLVSFGPTHHRFAYFHGAPIPQRPWPRRPEEFPAGDFCFAAVGPGEPTLPFAWERLAEVNCDRNPKRPVEERVVVGRRVPDVARK